jgi:hypothetical protein
MRRNFSDVHDLTSCDMYRILVKKYIKFFNKLKDFL